MKLALLLLAVLALPAQGQIYTWVDENGKKHFGDKVPEKYADQADGVKLDIRQPTAEEVAEAKARNEAMRESAYSMESTAQSVARDRKNARRSARSSTATGSRVASSGSSCAQQQAAYQAAKACYSACQVRTTGAPVTVKIPGGGSYVTTGRSVVNNQNCGHCRNVKKPSC